MMAPVLDAALAQAVFVKDAGPPSIRYPSS